jgi:Tol biopolymer transport system component
MKSQKPTIQVLLRGPSSATHHRERIVALGVILSGCSIFPLGVLQPQDQQKSVHTQEEGQPSLLVSSEGRVTDPRISPDGLVAVYVSNETGGDELFVIRLTTGERTRLTSDVSNKANPVFSADSSRIAFARQPAGSGNWEICAIPALGGRMVTIVSSAVNPAWSPDSDRLAFILKKPGETDALVTAGIDGTHPQVLLRGDAAYPFLGRLAWSPDGSEIAVTRIVGGHFRTIWLIQASGGEPRPLLTAAPGIFSDDPAYAENGQGIFYSTNRAGPTNIWYCPRNGGTLVRITNGTEGRDRAPSISKDFKLVFQNSESRVNLLLHNLETEQTRILFSQPRFAAWGPAFSPNDREIAFCGKEEVGDWHIWTLTTEGSNARRITSGDFPELSPRFTADGMSLVYFAVGAQRQRIFRVSRSGGIPTPIASSHPGDDPHGDLSPDGRSLVISRGEGGASHLYIVPINEERQWQLTATPSSVPRWSPDGKWIAFSASRSFDGGIYVIRADGTGQRKLTSTGGWPVWYPDGLHIAYQEISPVDTEEIRSIPASGGKSELMGGLRFHSSNNPFDFSHNGKLLVTTDTEHLADKIWMLNISLSGK